MISYTDARPKVDFDAAGLAAAVVRTVDLALPVGRVLVLGNNRAAGMARRYLMERGEVEVPAQPGAVVDTLIDATGDVARWLPALSRLRDEGTVVLLLSPSPQPLDFDFYREIHRRSLRLVAGRWSPSRQDPLVTERAELIARVAMAPADDGPFAAAPSRTALVRKGWTLRRHPKSRPASIQRP